MISKELRAFVGLQIVLGSKSSVQSGFERIAPIDLLLPLKHVFCQGQIGRIAFDDPTVDSRHSPLFDLALRGVSEHLVVDRFPSPIRQGLDVFIERRLFEPLVSDADAARTPDALAVDQVKGQLLVAEPEESHDHGRPQHLLGAHAFEPGTAIAAGFALAKKLRTESFDILCSSVNSFNTPILLS